MAKKEVVKEKPSKIKEALAVEAPQEAGDDGNLDEIFSGLESESE